MKKWYFSNNGDIKGPMDLDAAITYATDNPDVYGWHSSFKQWKPVGIISELGNIVSNKKPSIHLLDELISKFDIKKQRLEKKLSVIDNSIKDNLIALSVLETEISTYKKLTANLNDGVKAAIDPIEETYNVLKRKQEKLVNVAEIATSEIETLVTAFNQRIAEKTSGGAVSIESEAVVENVTAKVVNGNSVSHSSPAQSGSPAENKPKVKLVDVSAKSVKAAEQEIDNKAKKVVPIASETKAQKAVAQDAQENVDLNESAEEKKGFTGMKSMLKSVFKADEDEEQLQETSLSKLLAMEEENASKTANNEPSVNVEMSEEEKEKRVRRRTRRRR